jgi:hypothetical protein
MGHVTQDFVIIIITFAYPGFNLSWSFEILQVPTLNAFQFSFLLDNGPVPVVVGIALQ